MSGKKNLNLKQYFIHQYSLAVPKQVLTEPKLQSFYYS